MAKELYLPDREPEVAIRDLLIDGERTTPRWDALSGTFDDAWIHTGWYDEKNPNPQISVRPGGEEPRGARGWNSIHPGGHGPQTHVDGTIDVDIWVPGDRERIGTNPKKLVGELRREAERIVGENYDGTLTDDGDQEFGWLATGPWTAVPPEDDGPVEQHHHIPVYYTWSKHRVDADD